MMYLNNRRWETDTNRAGLAYYLLSSTAACLHTECGQELGSCRKDNTTPQLDQSFAATLWCHTIVLLLAYRSLQQWQLYNFISVSPHTVTFFCSVTFTNSFENLCVAGCGHNLKLRTSQARKLGNLMSDVKG